MNLPDDLIPMSWLIVANLVWLIGLFYSLYRAPWFKVKQDANAQRVFLVFTILIMFLWSLDADVGGGLSFHFLLATVATLMFGPEFAFIALSLAQLGITINGGSGIYTFGLNLLISAALPILISWYGFRLAVKYLPKHFFVYVFLNGFLVAALAMVVTALTLSLVLVMSGAQTYETISFQYMPLIPLMAGPEAFVNGFLITVMVLYKPEWVATFSDEHYLKGK